MELEHDRLAELKPHLMASGEWAPHGLLAAAMSLVGGETVQASLCECRVSGSANDWQVALLTNEAVIYLGQSGPPTVRGSNNFEYPVDCWRVARHEIGALRVVNTRGRYEPPSLPWDVTLQWLVEVGRFEFSVPLFPSGADRVTRNYQHDADAERFIDVLISQPE